MVEMSWLLRSFHICIALLKTISYKWLLPSQAILHLHLQGLLEMSITLVKTVHMPNAYVTGSEKTTLITQKRKIILLDRTLDEPILYRLQFVSGA